MNLRTTFPFSLTHIVLACLLILGMLGVQSAEPVHAATLTVTNTNDSGAGSLRQAIANAGDGDTVTFSGALSGQTISLLSQIEIEDDVTIDGSNLAYPVSIIASNFVRIFLVDSLATATINQIVMGNSYSADGAIIITHGDLTITNSTLAGGEATWLGGAIYNTGTLTVSGSTIFGNLAGSYGGAIYNTGTLEMYNSTIYGNTGDYGGGLYTNLSATSTVIHSTFAENTTTNGGSAVHSAGSLTLINSILDSNTGGTAECASSGPGSITVSDNVISDGSCGATLTSANLGPLADNGGPTETMAIDNLSSAKNNGDGVYCETTDQRGVARYGACDIGAYEYATSLTVDSTTDLGDGVCGVVECTLRDAVASIESYGVIDFDPSLADDTITLGSEIQIDGGLIIDGSALSPGVHVSGGDSTRVFHVLGTADVELHNLDIIQGGGVVFGGGIYNEGSLELYTCTVSENNATNIGGGIYSNNWLTVVDSTISNNSVNLYGAGVYSITGSLMVWTSTFESNDAGNDGGGIYAGSSTSTVNNSTFHGNIADDDGGGIYVSGGTLTVHNSTFSNNVITGSGGGIYNSLGTMYLENAILANSSGGNDCYSSNTSGTRINNLIENGSCGSALGSDPLLGPLADNGGPTQTMALLPGSPAIDVGDNPTCESDDQRGWDRPIDGDRDGTATCDIGAYERGMDLFLPLIRR